jgi:hypothetical protein
MLWNQEVSVGVPNPSMPSRRTRSPIGTARRKTARALRTPSEPVTMALLNPANKSSPDPSVGFLRAVPAWVAPRHCRGVAHKQSFAQTAAACSLRVARVWERRRARLTASHHERVGTGFIAPTGATIGSKPRRAILALNAALGRTRVRHPRTSLLTRRSR